MRTITVGRSNACDIIVNELNVSRIHAEIKLTNEGKYIFHDISSNGTTINGKNIINAEVTINSNSSILLANSIPLYWSKIEALLPTNAYIKETKTEISSSPAFVTNSKLAQKKGMFQNPFSFNGRIRRTEYGLSMIIYFVAIYSISFLSGFLIAASGADVSEKMWLIYVVLIPVFWFYIAQGAKRCHDRGNSGWFQIIPFYFLWMIFAEGDVNINEFGVNPK